MKTGGELFEGLFNTAIAELKTAQKGVPIF